MDGGQHPHRQASQPAQRVTGLPHLPQRQAQGSEGDAEGRNDTAPRAGGTRSGPGRANREDDTRKPTSRRNNVTLTAVSLFAGVGGFDLAMQRNGINVVAAVEIDEKARAVLARRFPDTRLFPDVTKVSAHDLRDAGFVPDRGIITGGFPCQDLSVAGRRKGLAGERSGLFWHIIRLVDELHPRWIVLENVPGLLSSEGGRDMGIVIGALGDSGYGVAYRVLDAQHFGVPQRRRRVFIVAGRRSGAADSTGPVQILLEPEGSSGNLAKGRTEGQEPAGTAGDGFAGRRIVNALTRDGLGGGGGRTTTSRRPAT